MGIVFNKDYGFIDGESKVGVEENVFGYAGDIGEELEISVGRVNYVIEFMVQYSSYIMGIGGGFRMRDYMVYPDLGSMEFKKMLEGDKVCEEILQRDLIRVYCRYMNMDEAIYNEYRNRGILMGNLPIRERKKILRRMDMFGHYNKLFKRKKRIRIDIGGTNGAI